MKRNKKIEKTKKIENMEKFKNNLENEKFSSEFIQLALNYFNELEEEKELKEMATIEEIIDYYAKKFSFTWNTLKSETNLKEVRKDLYLLREKDSNNLLEFNMYFENIEMFEIYVLYALYFEFYPEEE